MNVIDRLGALAGAGAAVLIVSYEEHNLLGGADPALPSSEVADTLVAGSADGGARFAAQLGLIGVVLLVIFAARLHGALSDAAPRAAWLPITVVAGAILLGGVVLIEIGFTYAATELADYGDDTAAARVFALWGWNIAGIFAPGLGALVAGTTAVVLTTKPFPEWYRWVCVLLLLGMTVIWGLGAPGFATVFGFLWMVLTSLMLTFRRTPAALPIVEVSVPAAV